MAIANVVLNGKTYAFASDQNGVITLLDRAGGVPTSFAALTLSQRPPTNNSQSSPWKTTIGLKLPVVADAASECACPGQVQRTSYVTITIEEPVTGTAAERTDLAEQLDDLFQNAQIKAMIATLTRPN